MPNLSAAESIQQLVQQQNSLLAQKALLREQVEATNKTLAEVRAVLQGVELGRLFAEQTATAAPEESADGRD